MATAADMTHPLVRALDWLADGVALIGAGNRVLHANRTLRAIAQRSDAIALKAGTIRLASAPARARLHAALAAALTGHNSGRRRAAAADFGVPRQDGGPPYLVSVRPLRDRDGGAYGAACAMLFVRDPLAYRSVDLATLRDIFGLTEAEACFAQSLQSGQAPADYARERALSLNTVYTHMRHLKDKTGCSRMTQLIRKLNELQVPLRPPSLPPPLAGREREGAARRRVARRPAPKHHQSW